VHWCVDGCGLTCLLLVVGQVMRRLVGPLVAEEAMLLLEGVDRGRRALEATGKMTGSDSRRWWALW
jgi:hypothetical protein